MLPHPLRRRAAVNRAPAHAGSHADSTIKIRTDQWRKTLQLCLGELLQALAAFHAVQHHPADDLMGLAKRNAPANQVIGGVGGVGKAGSG